MIVTGLVRLLTGAHHPPPVRAFAAEQSLTVFLLLRAFASGSTAPTGVEAISKGVPAFRRPESRNAAATLTVWACCSRSSSSGSSPGQRLPRRPPPHRARRGEHVLRGLPPAGLDPVTGPLPPGGPPQPGGQARVLERHRVAGPRRRRGAVAVRGQRPPHHPALCDRRVHELHPLPARDGRATGPGSGDRGGDGRPWSTVSGRRRRWSHSSSSASSSSRSGRGRSS